MIDFNKLLEEAARKAKERQEKNNLAVSDEEIAARIMTIANAGYIPDAQTPEIIKAYLQGRGLLLSGPAGTGKTFLMTLLAGTQAMQHADRDINDWGLSGIHGWYDWRDGLTVVIDDLGCERTACSYGDKEDLLKVVIEHRYAAQKGITHVTTNLSAGQISERYGERILDRLMEMCTPFRFTGESYRRKPMVIK